MHMFWKLEDVNDKSKSTWQAKIQFVCIDRYSGVLVNNSNNNILKGHIQVLEEGS